MGLLGLGGVFLSVWVGWGCFRVKPRGVWLSLLCVCVLVGTVNVLLGVLLTLWRMTSCVDTAVWAWAVTLRTSDPIKDRLVCVHIKYVQLGSVHLKYTVLTYIFQTANSRLSPTYAQHYRHLLQLKGDWFSATNSVNTAVGENEGGTFAWLN